MPKILLLGSGFVAQPALDYILRRSENHVTVGSAHIENAKKLVGDRPNCTAIGIDVIKENERFEKIVAEHDLLISLIPWSYHMYVLKAAIKLKKNVVTTSYVSPAMMEVDQQAKDAGITILNEVGLDPGIDHFYALKLINDVKKEGGKILSFTSYCGGLPAPEASNNPLGYKFSWSPRGVLLALRSTAKWLEDGKVCEVKPGGLMNVAKPIYVYPAFAFEGYPNRDSTPYDKRYNIPEAKTILRGTLRYQGNPKFMQALTDMGFLDQEERSFLAEGAEPISWRKTLSKLFNTGDSVSELEAKAAELAKIQGEEKSRVLAGMKWLGLFSDAIVPQKGCYLDSLAATLYEKMQYQEKERDMVMLQHKFEIELASGQKEIRTSTMLEYGEPGGVTAMAKTVGIPCGIAVQLVLDGKIDRKGVLAPMSTDIYEPIIELLEKEGIKCVEEVL